MLVEQPTVEMRVGLAMIEAAPFPASDLKTLGIAVANRLRDVLETGASELGFAGLNAEPIFINRRGAGGGRDQTTHTVAKVRFFDDVASGVPEVVIVGIQAQSERAGYGDELWAQTCLAVLDCNTNQFQPGSLSEGIDAATTGAILGNYVEAMLRNDELMMRTGFTDPRVAPGAPPGVLGKDGVPMEFHYPISVQFEIYISKI